MSLEIKHTDNNVNTHEDEVIDACHIVKKHYIRWREVLKA